MEKMPRRNFRNYKLQLLDKFRSKGDMNMKIVGVLLTSVPHDGGQHQYLLTMMDALLAGRNRGIKVVGICCSRFWYEWCEENNVKYVIHHIRRFSVEEMNNKTRFCSLKKWFNTYCTELGNIVRNEKIDLLITGQQETYIPKMNCKIISLIHDLMHRYERQFHEIGNCYEDHEALYGGMACIANTIIVESKLGKKQLVECYGNRLKNTKIEVLPFTAPPYILEHEEEWIDTPDKYIFYPAQLWRHKNHINLIKAIQLLNEKGNDISLVLVGSKKNASDMVFNYINDNNLNDKVKMLGYVSNEQMIYLYKHALAMVMPSYFGPTNIPPLEAMALGCPTIVSNNYAMGEQVGEAGLLFNPDSPEEIADCILEVLNNPEKRQSMIDLGLQETRKWSTKEFSEKFLQIVFATLEEK